VVDEYLAVPGHPEVYAVGAAAAVPDLTRPGELTPMTAQHAQRQGQRAACNIAASYGQGRRRPYRHHDLGFLVDLGGTQAAANPVGVPLAGLPAKAVTRGYHLLALPGNRTRTAADWLLDAALSARSCSWAWCPRAGIHRVGRRAVPRAASGTRWRCALEAKQRVLARDAARMPLDAHETAELGRWPGTCSATGTVSPLLACRQAESGRDRPLAGCAAGCGRRSRSRLAPISQMRQRKKAMYPAAAGSVTRPASSPVANTGADQVSGLGRLRVGIAAAATLASASAKPAQDRRKNPLATV
jgi:hypothetical protein